MKRVLMTLALVAGGLLLSGAVTSTAEAHGYGGGYRYHGGGCYHGGYRAYGYRPYYRPYAPGVIVTTPGFGIATPGVGFGVGPVYGVPAPYPAYGFGYYRW